MKRILFLSTVLIAGVFVLTIYSCKKEKPDTETQSAVDNSICEEEFTKSMNNANSYGIGDQGIKSIEEITTCATIGLDTTQVVNGVGPRILTVDYGTGCSDSVDHKTRYGKIIYTFSKRWSKPGATIKITFVNYKVNNNSFHADSIKLSRTANSFTAEVFKGVCTNSVDNWTLRWEGIRTITHNVGSGLYSMTGSSNGVNRSGLSYTTNITVALEKRTTCSWIERGRLDLTPQGLATRTVDFGDGTCDNKAALIINGNSFSFILD